MCDVYHTTVLGDADATRILIMPKACFFTLAGRSSTATVIGGGKFAVFFARSFLQYDKKTRNALSAGRFRRVRKINSTGVIGGHGNQNHERS